MSLQLTNNVLINHPPGLGPLAVIMLAAIANTAGTATRYAYCRQRHLARITEISERHQIRVLASLEAAGLITIYEANATGYKLYYLNHQAEGILDGPESPAAIIHDRVMYTRRDLVDHDDVSAAPAFRRAASGRMEPLPVGAAHHVDNRAQIDARLDRVRARDRTKRQTANGTNGPPPARAAPPLRE